MNDSFHDAVEELKRVDHLIYVSLKYTRTVDVIRNTLKRVINAFEFGLDALLEFKKIEDYPNVPKAKIDLVRKNFDDPILHEYLRFYFFLRKLFRSEYKKREEFRRHVTMISTYASEHKIEVNIDNLESTYERMVRNFIKHVSNIMEQ